jgi:hypothetical protein
MKEIKGGKEKRWVLQRPNLVFNIIIVIIIVIISCAGTWLWT